MSTGAFGEAHLDVVIVGAGAAGSAAAWWLARRGRRVALVDRFDAGHVRGSSHGTERIFRMAYADPTYVQLARESLPLWRELEVDSATALLTTTGGLDTGFPDELAAIAHSCASHDVDVEWLEEVEVRRRFPGLHLDGPAVLQPDAGCTHADATLAALQHRAAALGAAVHHDEQVVAIEPEAERERVVVRTERQRLVASTCIVAAGAWAAPLLDGLVALPAITVTQEQVAFFSPRDGTSGPWPTFVDRNEESCYGLPTPTGLVKVGEHYTGLVIDPDRRTFELEPTGWARLLRWVSEHVPGVDPEPVASTTCLYASSPDEDFVVDRVGNIVVAAGLGGHGFKFAPLLGRHLADLAEGSGWPGNPFTLDRRALAAGRSGHK